MALVMASLNNEELIRYALGSATTELEAELVKRLANREDDFAHSAVVSGICPYCGE